MLTSRRIYSLVSETKRSIKQKAQTIMNNPDAWATLDSRHGTKTNKTKTYTEKE
jgi:hypothetical protein